MNMRSGPAPGPAEDDRSAKARIRDAAIDVIAEVGLGEATVRRIATAAGVSPGLVMHHFGSMDGLRVACDSHVAATIRQVKEEALTAGPQIDLLGAMRASPFGSMIGYLAEVLTDDSPTVARLVDELVADAEGYFAQGVESGVLIPSDDPRGRAVVLAMWSLGALVLHRHLKRLIDFDMTATEFSAEPGLTTYLRPVSELLGTGFYTEDFARAVSEALASDGAEDAE